jgi:hypothetical protein
MVRISAAPPASAPRNAAEHNPAALAALAQDEARRQTLEVIDLNNQFTQAERMMLEGVRNRVGKAALPSRPDAYGPGGPGGPDALDGSDRPDGCSVSGGVFEDARAWYDAAAAAFLDRLPTDRQKLTFARMVSANRDSGLHGVAIWQAQQEKVYQASLVAGCIKSACANLSKRWGDPDFVDDEVDKAHAAIDAIFPETDNSAHKLEASQKIYGQAVQLALAYGGADDFASARELLFGQTDAAGRRVSEGVHTRLTPALRDQAIATLRVQEMIMQDRDAYGDILRDAEGDPARALILLDDAAYAPARDWAADTRQDVRALLENQAGHQLAQAEKARDLADEAASKALYDAWVESRGQMSSADVLAFARDNPGAAHLVVPFLQNVRQARFLMQSGDRESCADQAEQALSEASRDKTLTGHGWRLLLQYAPALPPERRERWRRIVAEER